jgi:hypothetical protein
VTVWGASWMVSKGMSTFLSANRFTIALSRPGLRGDPLIFL